MADQAPESPPGLGLIPLLSVIGSVASLAALVIVLIDQVAKYRETDPQFMVWQIALALASLMAIGATVAVLSDYIYRSITAPQFTVRAKTIRVFVGGVLGLLLVALFIDGLYAALYWRWWLGPLIRNVRVSTGERAPPTSVPLSGAGLLEASAVNAARRRAITEESVKPLATNSRTISPGTETEGRLGFSESENVEGWRVAAWILRPQRSGKVTIELRSQDFDAYLIVAAPRLGLLEDDDSGGGRNARLEVQVRPVDTLQIIVTSFRPGQTGMYTLRITGD